MPIDSQRFQMGSGKLFIRTENPIGPSMWITADLRSFEFTISNEMVEHYSMRGGERHLTARVPVSVEIEVSGIAHGSMGEPHVTAQDILELAEAAGLEVTIHGEQDASDPEQVPEYELVDPERPERTIRFPRRDPDGDY